MGEEIRKMIKAQIAKNGEERVIDVLDENEIDYTAINAAKEAISSTVGATPVKKSSREKWLAKRERKMRAKARKLEQGEENDVPAEVEDEPTEVGQPKGKRKKQKTVDSEKHADRGTAKRKKEKKAKGEGLEVTDNVESEQSSRKAKKRSKL